MTTKNRIAKLEKARGADTTRKQYVCKFTQEVRADGVRYFIGAAQVDAAKYAKEHAEYLRLHTDSKIPGELIIYGNDEGEESTGTIIIYVDDASTNSQPISGAKIQTKTGE